MASFAIATAEAGRLIGTGELSFETAARALQQGNVLIGRGGRWVIDLSRVESGDSAGVAVLVEWLATAHAVDATVRYEGIPSQMLAIARISDLEDLLLGN
jgi:phospholipid transport system transporter-binding protein